MGRLQPVNTSAHRVPRIHIPDSLAQASHVFVLRGGHQPALTSPYMGPFRVVSRGPDSYRIALPGRGVDSVNIARLKPAVVAEDDDGAEIEPETPPSPPPPGRRPGIRSRPPPPTDRVTRRRVQFDDQQPSTSSSSPSTSSSSSRPVSSSAPPTTSSSAASTSTASSATAPRLPAIQDEEQEVGAPSSEVTDNEPFLEPHTDPVALPAPPPAPRFFTRPAERQFSRQRPRTGYGAVLNAILKQQTSSSSD